MPTRVLFVCAANAARSQIAEAHLRNLGGRDFEVHSAGIRPRDKIHPLKTRVLAAIHIDVSMHMTKSIDRFKSEGFDVFREALWEIRRRVELFVTVARSQVRPRRPQE